MLPNISFLMGRICKSEFRHTKGGKPVLNARLSIADGSGIIDIVFWEAIAERAREMIDFDSKPNLLIQGSLRQDKWENVDTGEPRTKFSIKVERFYILADLNPADGYEDVGFNDGELVEYSDGDNPGRRVMTRIGKFHGKKE